MFHADVIVILGLQELLNAWVQNLLQPGSFLGQSQGGSRLGVTKEACLDVGEIGAEPRPHLTVPVRSRSWTTLIVLHLVCVDPHGICVTIQQSLERIVVGVACVHRGLNDGVPAEALLGALVLRQGQGIRGGGPAHHVHHLLTAEIRIATDFGVAEFVQAHENASWLVVLQDGRTELAEAIASTEGVRVGHATMQLSSGQAITNHGIAPAVRPSNFRHVHLNVTDAFQALGDVLSDALRFKVRLRWRSHEGIAGPIDILSQNNLWFLHARHDSRNGWFLELRSAHLVVVVVLVFGRRYRGRGGGGHGRFVAVVVVVVVVGRFVTVVVVVVVVVFRGGDLRVSIAIVFVTTTTTLQPEGERKETKGHNKAREPHLQRRIAFRQGSC
mmetsp:Transcript_7069/g.11525  ORF Transcript_7069/g.11525 Transcript_7069/m.11525 type:complete len:385 (-) Transcript_7069:19-1173(-)